MFPSITKVNLYFKEYKKFFDIGSDPIGHGGLELNSVEQDVLKKQNPPASKKKKKR